MLLGNKQQLQTSLINIQNSIHLYGVDASAQDHGRHGRFFTHDPTFRFTPQGARHLGGSHPAPVPVPGPFLPVPLRVGLSATTLLGPPAFEPAVEPCFLRPHVSLFCGLAPHPPVTSGARQELLVSYMSGSISSLLIGVCRAGAGAGLWLFSF